MRIGRYDISVSRNDGEAVELAAAAQPTKRKPDEEYGASGTQNLDGFVQTHEYNRDLVFPRSIHVYRKMIRSDPDVQEARNHTRAPLLTAQWDVEAASDDELDQEVAAFVRAAYFDWPQQPVGDEWPFGSFSEYLDLSLRYLDNGFSLIETPLKLIEDDLEWRTPAGEDRAVRRQWLTWKKFAERLPETIAKWQMEDGLLMGVEQWAWKGDRWETMPIPASAFVLLINEREGDDFYGKSVLRSSWKPFVLKECVEKVMGVSAERHGIGVNTAYVPQTANADSQVIDRVEEMMRDLNGGDRPYLVFPGPKGEVTSTNTDGGYFFEIVTPNSSALPELIGLCEYFRSAIKGNMLARFAELGHGRTGARSTGDTQQQVWYDALHAVAQHICDVNEIAIRRLVDLNYAVKRYPRLVCRDIESRNLTEFAEAHAQLVLAQAILPDSSYRKFIRQGMGAPDEDEDAEEQLDDGLEDETQPGERPGGQPIADPDDEAVEDPEPETDPEQEGE